jgi:Tfp pilus assembly protein PilF
MDRKEGAAGFLSLFFVVTPVLSVPLTMVLVLLLAVLPGCNPQGSSLRGVYQQIRPVTNTARLVKNAAYLKKTGRVELAVKELEEAHLQEPKNLEILDVLIQCYEDLGHFDRAQELYEEALSRAGHHPALENNRCYSLYLQGHLGQAEACFRKVLARQPENQAARNNLGLVLVRQGRETEALAMWREALSDVEAQRRLGQASAALGKELPPSLAVPTSAPAEQQVAASSNSTTSSATAVPDSSVSVTQVQGNEERQPHPQVKSANPPVPASSQPATQAQKTTQATLTNQKPVGTQEQVATQTPQTDTITPATGSLALPSSSPSEQPVAESVPAPPEKPMASAHTKKEQSATPIAIPTVNKDQAISTPKLTAMELHGTQIELKNGNGINNRSRDLRSLLWLEGFTVAGIGNHKDFRLEETVIAYRPEAKRVAQVLAQKYFPGAKLKEGGKLSQRADIRVTLGRDRLADQGIVGLHHNKTYAANGSGPFSASVRVATTPPEKNTTAEVSRSPANPPASLPTYLTSQELNQVRIELKNGNGIENFARKWRRCLRLEGFTVVGIGNHRDFGLEKTVIAYRPEGKRVAQVLVQKFFPGAKLEETVMLSPTADVQLSLGRDLFWARGNQPWQVLKTSETKSNPAHWPPHRFTNNKAKAYPSPFHSQLCSLFPKNPGEMLEPGPSLSSTSPFRRIMF